MFEKTKLVFFSKWICRRGNMSHFQEFLFSSTVQIDRGEGRRDQVQLLMKIFLWQFLPACACPQKVIKA